MSIVVVIETEANGIKKTSLEAIAYGAHAAQETAQVLVVAFGEADHALLQSAGNAGADKVYHFADATSFESQVETLVAFIQSHTPRLVLMARSNTNDLVAAHCAAKVVAPIISGVTTLPTYQGDTLVVEKSIFSGKATMQVQTNAPLTFMLLRKNSLDTLAQPKQVEIIPAEAHNAIPTYQITKVEKASSDISLSDADIIVSGGRGMQSGEQWQPLLDLAKALGAATGCSKPVSDLHWRPHHEHIGQTGLKVAPNLYIACGISGAIQHLAGVNGSKCIVVINKDPEAPFFKEATYGIVGDVFEVLPRLTQAVLAAK